MTIEEANKFAFEANMNTPLSAFNPLDDYMPEPGYVDTKPRYFVEKYKDKFNIYQYVGENKPLMLLEKEVGVEILANYGLKDFTWPTFN